MNDKLLLGIYGVKDVSSGVAPGIIHDHNLTVFSANSLEHFIHLERITRKKYDATLENELEALAKHLKLIDHSNLELCFVDHEIGKAFQTSAGQVRFEANSLTDPIHEINAGKALWFGKEVPAYWISHEIAHIYSCIPFYGSFKDKSLLVHYDGGASRSNFSVWEFSKGQLKNLAYHTKLRKYTEFFNANALSFRLTGTNPKDHNSVPGKLMGLAAYGNYSSEIEIWLEKYDFFKNIWSSHTGFLEPLQKDWGITLKQIDNKNRFLQDIAATMHTVFIRESIMEIAEFANKDRYKNLYFTGGCALNIKLNSMLLNSGMFEEVFIPPCTNDSGLSLGAATALALKNNYSVPGIGPYISGFSPNLKNDTYSEKVVYRTAKLLKEGKILGVCNSFGEAGPRALGNRSILCRADSPQLAKKLSQECKGREWYRPLAPVMLKEQAIISTGRESFPQAASLMLFEFSILAEHKESLAGAVHADGSSRIQIISGRHQNPFLFDLLHVCLKRFGIGALINTSLNKKGEPIVQTHNEARDSAKCMNLDAVILDGELELLG